MTSRVSQDIDLRQGFVRSLEERREPGAAEVYERLQEMLGRAESWNGAIRLERLKQAVYRVQVGDGSGRALILKRHPRPSRRSIASSQNDGSRYSASQTAARNSWRPHL